MKAITKTLWSGSDLRADLKSSSPSGATQIAYASPLTGAIARSIQARLGDMVSVKDFGAKGDGSVDDTAAIQLAIDSGAQCIFFPEGTYIVSGLTPASNQSWVGSGRASTTLAWPPVSIPPTTHSMVRTTSDLRNFHVLSMTFRGSRPYQTTPSTTGQDLGCFHLRGGDVIDVSITNCEIVDFGDAAGVGGFGVLIGATAGEDHIIDNITITECVFENISNVPGVYINGDGTYHSALSRITIDRNQFAITIDNADQNCIYVLGGNGVTGTDVVVDSNKFLITKAIDCAIELNWISGFQVSHNTITAQGGGTCTPVLVRDGCNLGTIAGNQIQDHGTGTAAATAIGLIQFANGVDTQTNISVVDNIIQGWGTGVEGRALSIGAGSSQIICSDNIITGRDSDNPTNYGIAIGTNVANLLISDNIIRDCRHMAIFSGTATNVLLESNLIDRCGDGEATIVTDSVPDHDLTFVVFKDNTISNPVSGTMHFVSLSPIAATGNRIETNTMPSALNAMNPSYVNKFDSIMSPATGSGRAIAVQSYSFAQGPVAMADAEGFTIGGNLDGQTPQCTFGDMVVASFNGDSLGVTITAWVSGPNQIRIRCQNETGASVTIPDGNWSVLIFKQ